MQDAEVVSGYGEGFDAANGSFEGAARDDYRAFGWRYFDGGVVRVQDAAAADGEFYVRLPRGKKIHQCIDATGDFKPGGTTGNQAYSVTAAIRSTADSGMAAIAADFEAQSLYNRAHQQRQTFTVTDQWDDYTATFTAPDGTWKVYVTLESAGGDIEFDKVRVSPLDPHSNTKPAR